MGKNNVLVDGRSVVTAASGGIATAFPDVCQTPGPTGVAIALPYPNVARSADVTDGPTSVTIGGAMPLTKGAKIASSNGNEAGSLGGLASGVTGGEAEAASYSFGVRIEGMNVVRNGDATLQNSKNAAGTIIQP